LIDDIVTLERVLNRKEIFTENFREVQDGLGQA